MQAKYEAQGFIVLAFPCPQFGLQEIGKNEEILNCLKYVRPGNGFEPKFPIFGKMNVNGDTHSPLYGWLKQTTQDTSGGCGNRVWITNTSPIALTLQPVNLEKGEVQWNFEKFLIGRNGKVFKRYLPQVDPSALASDIEALLKSS